MTTTITIHNDTQNPATERGSSFQGQQQAGQGAQRDPQVHGGPMRLADLVEGYWAITDSMHDEIRSIYAAHMRGDKIDLNAVEARIGRPLSNDRAPYQVQDGVALIQLSGVMAPKANLFMSISGGTSSQQLRADILAAVDDPSVKCAILVADSPGGNVLGTFEAAQALRELAAVKPVVTYSDGTLASAAYLVGSAANAVYVSGSAVNVGSIGVRTEIIDTSMADAQAGRKRHILVAGKYKAAGDGQFTPEAAAYKQTQLDYLYSLFVDTVALQRGVSSAQVLADMADGRVFMGQQAVDAGLVDGISSLEALMQAMATDPKSVTQRRVKRKTPAQLAASASATDSSSPASASAGAAPAEAPTAAPSSAPVVPAAQGDQPTPEGASMSQDTNPSPGGITTVEALAAAHPTLVEQIRTTAHATGHAAGMTAGAAAERDRIQAVRAQSLPGHEALVEQLAFDGKTTGPDAAVAVLAAQRTALKGHASAHFGDAPPAAAAARHSGAGAEPPRRSLDPNKAYAALNQRAPA